MITKIIDLSSGMSTNSTFRLKKWDGGEVHFTLYDQSILEDAELIKIITRLNSSDDIMALFIALDTLHKDMKYISKIPKINIYIPYMPYQQADRDFGFGDSFSLSTFIKLLESFTYNVVYVYMPHSDVTMTLHRSIKIDDFDFIEFVLRRKLQIDDSKFVILTPDSGAYKRTPPIIKKLKFAGALHAANKYREITTSAIESIELSTQDFGGKDILIIDDLCMYGNTFISLAKEIRKRNAGKLYLAVSHMIHQLPNPLLLESFDCVFTTNSRFGSFIVNNEMVDSDSQNKRFVVYDIMSNLIM